MHLFFALMISRILELTSVVQKKAQDFSLNIWYVTILSSMIFTIWCWWTMFRSAIRIKHLVLHLDSVAMYFYCHFSAFSILTFAFSVLLYCDSADLYCYSFAFPVFFCNVSLARACNLMRSFSFAAALLDRGGRKDWAYLYFMHYSLSIWLQFAI